MHLFHLAASLPDLPLRLPANFLNRIKLIWVVQIFTKKYSGFHRTQITGLCLSSRSARGAFGHRHERWDGMRWMRSAQLTNGADAYGEVVWS